MKRILVLSLSVLLAFLFSACNEQPEQFSVTMTESYNAHDPITVTVNLPGGANESDLTFDIDGTLYSVTSMPTVSAPTFVFADVADDGMQSVCLVLASDNAGDAVLYMRPDEGTVGVELCFVADMKAFSKLTNYLRTN